MRQGDQTDRAIDMVLQNLGRRVVVDDDEFAAMVRCDRVEDVEI